VKSAGCAANTQPAHSNFHLHSRFNISLFHVPHTIPSVIVVAAYVANMEAVGLAASLITLIGAASLASATITRAIGLRGCPQSVLTSRNEVEDFKGVLLIAQQALGDLDYDNEQIRRLLTRAQTRIEAFDTFLKEKVLRDDVRPHTDGALRLRKRAKWKEVIGELQSEIDTLKQELSSIKQSLNVALAAANL
jgi:hypothetical protein